MTTSADITFHFPPELFNLLVDTVPLLNRSKKDVLQFFRGAGAPADVLDDLAKRLKSAPAEINKYEITRTVLDALNARGTRGKMLEAALNDLFAAYGILVKHAFHLVGQSGEGVVEQIDGVIELKGALYFVEMKWYAAPVGVPEISQHLVRLMGRAEARGIFISASDYTDPALHTSREFLQQKVIVLATLQELVLLLEQQGDLAEFFINKIQAAQIHKNPYFKFG